MTNLDVLRAVQHAWPGYCWPFANSAGNGYSLGPSPSPPGSSMNDSKVFTSDSSAILVNSNQGRRPRSQGQTCRTSYEDQLLRMTCPPSSSPSRTKTTSGVKSERLSPDPVNADRYRHQNNHASSTPSPSTSPKSQSSNRTKTPSSFTGTPPHPAFTPPMSLPPGCFSPAALGTIAPMSGIQGATPNLTALPRTQNFNEPPMPRNCSDLMRSLAAKYNNNSCINTNNNNEYYNPLQRPPVNTIVQSKHLYLSPNITQQKTELEELSTQNSTSADTKLGSAEFNINNVKSNIHKSPPPALLPANLTQNTFPIGAPNPLSSLTHTQALLDMVRNASSNNVNKILRNSSPLHPSANGRESIDVVRVQSPIPLNTTSAKRPADSSSPLDLSSSVSAKRSKVEENSSDLYSDSNDLTNGRLSHNLNSKSPEIKYHPNTKSQSTTYKSPDDILTWTVEDVQDFVKSIDLCAEYADVFRDQRIDGWCLSLLTESHLTSSLKMKLGPALKLKSILSTKTVHSHQHSNGFQQCNSCHNNNIMVQDKHDDLHSTHSIKSPLFNHPESPTNSQSERSVYCSEISSQNHSRSPALHSPTPSEK